MVEYLFDLPDPILETLDSYMSLAVKEENVKGILFVKTISDVFVS